MRRRTEKVKKNLVLLNERPYTVEIFTSQILREIDFSIKIDFTSNLSGYISHSVEIISHLTLIWQKISWK